MGCLAHPCQSVCPKGAISMKNGKSVIDQEKCIKCGKCREICPYDAICHKERPCKAACGIGAITSDHLGRAVIDNEKCVSCGQCMVSCPFGAIADKSQIFQLIRAMQSGRKIIAQVAPAFVGQFGPKVTPEMFKTALKELGLRMSMRQRWALTWVYGGSGTLREGGCYRKAAVCADFLLPFLVCDGEESVP